MLFFKNKDLNKLSVLPDLITKGNVFFTNQKYKQALGFYKKAYLLKPDYEYAIINIANTYFELKQYTLAIDFAEKHICAETLNIIGASYLELDEPSLAVDAFEEALTKSCDLAWTYNHLSQAYQKISSYEKALEAGWNAILADGLDDSHHINYSYLMYEVALDKGVGFLSDYLKNWELCYPENPIVTHTSSALSQDKSMTRVNDKYLKKIFDIFAPDFEEVLLGLDYNVPILLQKYFTMISPVYGKVLDLGCGTGLCAKNILLSNPKLKFDGVDISEQMINEARCKKIYNNLYCEEIESFLENNKVKYNYIIAGDVFTYFGDLSNLFAKIIKSLNSNDSLVFSIADNYLNKEDYLLGISGRFGHSKNYVLSLLESNGYVIDFVNLDHLRNEGDAKVMGYIISAHKK